jgi:hypothetical protein
MLNKLHNLLLMEVVEGVEDLNEWTVDQKDEGGPA